MIVTAVVLAIIIAVIEIYCGGIKEPWRQIVIAGVVILFVVGLIMLLAPGLIPLRGF